MARLTFSGGIHPYDGKDLSKDKPIKEVLPKGDLVYPLSQHIGAPAQPIVKKGDKVLTGQKIAEAGGFVSAPIYATVSGTVKAIEPRRVVTGDNVMSIVIENDGLYEEVEWPAVKPFEELTREEKIEMITDILKVVFIESNLQVPINGESKLHTIYADVKRDILPYVTGELHNIDFTGRLFNVMNECLQLFKYLITYNSRIFFTDPYFFQQCFYLFSNFAYHIFS